MVTNPETQVLTRVVVPITRSLDDPSGAAGSRSPGMSPCQQLARQTNSCRRSNGVSPCLGIGFQGSALTALASGSSSVMSSLLAQTVPLLPFKSNLSSIPAPSRRKARSSGLLGSGWRRSQEG